MSEPTPDTPQEREEKAVILQIEREELARVIAQETRKFRLEVRFYWLAVLVILWLNT